MALALPDRWVWDSWYAWDDDTCHVFYLCASRGLKDPEERHRAPAIGHAVSKDLVNWDVLPDALAPSQEESFDSWTTWTGSVVRAPDGQWRMFYTGSSREDGGLIQRIGAAQSPDLMKWEKIHDFVLEADPRWYETLEEGMWPDQAWRDPWVFQESGRNDWTMLNSRSALIFFYVGFGVALSTFLYHGFISNIPYELDEAAAMDGASDFMVFRRIIFPMLSPVTATVAIVNGLWIWNNFLLPSLVLTQDLRTLPLRTYVFCGTYTSDYGLAMAGLVLSVAPIVLFYFVMQKQIISGVSAGAVK